MLILSEADVRRCLPIELAIEASRTALGSLRRERDGGAIVPTRIGLPYRARTSGSSSGDGTREDAAVDAAEDWTLFKPAAYYPKPGAATASGGGGGDEDLMGMKLVSVRAGNPALGLPTVPATVMLVDCTTGQASALLGGTYLTAARTAAGSAIATDVCCVSDGAAPINLVVFGAGLQAEMHVEAIRAVRQVQKITIVNRSAGRAENLLETIQAKDSQRFDNGGNDSADSTIPTGPDLNFVLLGDRDAIRRAVSEADVICATTNTTTPLFDGSWAKPGCHINGIGSYTSAMEEIDSNFVSARCQVIVDTWEALEVGDLKLVSNASSNFVGLLGDVLAGNSSLRRQEGKGSGSVGECTFFKSCGTAIQDVITAHEVFKVAKQEQIGMHVDL